jgi:Tat protein secretion system quality control protein TatD with DNase activity
MCLNSQDHPSSNNESEDSTAPSYPTSELINNLLSTLPAIPPVLRSRLHDAHTHPSDTPDSLRQHDPSASGSLCAMSTRPNDQSIVSSFAQDNPETVIPFFGYHPWFAHLFFSNERQEHYEGILKPAPEKEYLEHLPKPISWDSALQELRQRLKSDPKAQVGEIGLDKSFRLPTHTDGERDPSARKDLSPYRTIQEHQLRIFTDQCKLAGEFGRAVSIHGVQCHGLVFTALQSLWKGHEKKSQKSIKRQQKTANGNLETTSLPNFPPRVCLHSASLPIDTLKQYLVKSIPSVVYFSFSTVINGRYGQKLIDLIRAVPDDRILIESDWHCEGDVRRNQLYDIARVVMHAKDWSIEQGVEILEHNFQKFVYG